MLTFHHVPTSRDLARRRREAIQLLRPCFTSRRLVRVFYEIGMLAVTRPETLRTVEVLVARLANRRTERMDIAARRAKRSSA